jgi:branched-chain amino acid transport system substrate-binding protein
MGNRQMTKRNRLRTAWLTIFGTFVLLAVTACTGSSGGATSASPGTTAPLVIGASLSLTGDFADSGQAVEKGYQLWADTVNASGGILGRQVEMKIVDDASSPTQVITNYQTLINKDKVDLVFGPFSSLLTLPAAQVAKRYGYSFIEPAGGGPTVFAAKLDNLFFVQPAPVVQSGLVFADWVLSLPAAQRPKTAAYAELDDPFSAPIAEAIRLKFEANGIKTVSKQVYSAETRDLTPVMAKVAAANPDVLVSGTQNEDAYAQVKSLVQLGFNPKFMYMSNGANSPLEFPKQVGANNVNGIFSGADWFPGSKAAGSADFAKAYIAKYGGTEQQIDPSSAEAYACGQLLQQVAEKTGKIDNQTIISTLHSGTWPTVVGDLSWNAYGQPTGSFSLVQWIKGQLLPVYPADVSQAQPVYPKPNWGG